MRSPIWRDLWFEELENVDSTAPGWFTPRYPTEGVASGSRPPTDYFETIDEDSAGDDAGGAWHLVPEAPSHDHYMVVGGRTFAYLSRRLKLNTIGKVVHTEILARLAELNAKGGGELIIRDIHIVAASITHTCTAIAIIDFGLTGKLQTPPGPNPEFAVLNLSGNMSGDTNLRHITVAYPRIDVSAGDVGGTGLNQGSALHFSNFLKVEVHGGHLYGGAEYPSTHGDSGLETVNITDLLVDGLTVKGFRDSAIYLSGGSELGVTRDGYINKVVNSHIELCGNGIISKRQLHDTIVQGNSLSFCNRGICSEGADTAQQPGRMMQIMNNLVEKTRGQAIALMGPTKAIIANNFIKDFGYAADGVTLSGSTPIGIFLDGVSETLIQGNRIEMVDWAVPAGSLGIRVGDDPNVFGTAYTGGRISSSGNRIKNVDIGISEGMTWGNLWKNEYFSSVADIANLSVNSHLTYFDEHDTGGVGRIVTSIAHLPYHFRNGVCSYTADVADDSAMTFQLPTLRNTFLVTICADNIAPGLANGTVWVRQSPAEVVNVNLQTTTQITMTTGVLTGTTGPDTHTTLSIAGDHVFYLENRTGSLRRYSILVQPA